MSEKKRHRGEAGPSATGKKSRPSSRADELRKQLKSDADILESVRRMSAASKSSTYKTLTLSDLNLSSACREVSDRDSSAVLLSIERAALDAARSILSGSGFSFDIPSRSSSRKI